MSQPIRGQGGHLVFPIGPKNTSWVEDVEILLKFLSSFVEFRSVVSEKSKMSQPIRVQGGHLVFPIGPKNTNLIRDVMILLPVKFCWIPFNGFWEVENVSANQRPGRPSCFSCQVLINYHQWFQRRSRKSEKLTTTNVEHLSLRLVFPIGPKNTNLVEDVEILLSVKFRWIPFSGFREVENVSANQRPGRPSCFSDRPEKHKLSRGCWDLAYCQVLLNSVQQFQRRSRKCPSKS